MNQGICLPFFHALPLVCSAVQSSASCKRCRGRVCLCSGCIATIDCRMDGSGLQCDGSSRQSLLLPYGPGPNDSRLLFNLTIPRAIGPPIALSPPMDDSRLAILQMQIEFVLRWLVGPWPGRLYEYSLQQYYNILICSHHAD